VYNVSAGLTGRQQRTYNTTTKLSSQQSHRYRNYLPICLSLVHCLLCQPPAVHVVSLAMLHSIFSSLISDILANIVANKYLGRMMLISTTVLCLLVVSHCVHRCNNHGDPRGPTTLKFLNPGPPMIASVFSNEHNLIK